MNFAARSGSPQALSSERPGLATRVAVTLLRAYQLLVSPWLGSHCRFAPSCSAYAIDAIRRHGVLAGGWRTAGRLARCHPYSEGGYDPVR